MADRHQRIGRESGHVEGLGVVAIHPITRPPQPDDVFVLHPSSVPVWAERRPSGMFFGGGVSERPKENASKAFVG